MMSVSLHAHFSFPYQHKMIGTILLFPFSLVLLLHPLAWIRRYPNFTIMAHRNVHPRADQRAVLQKSERKEEGYEGVVSFGLRCQSKHCSCTINRRAHDEASCSDHQRASYASRQAVDDEGIGAYGNGACHACIYTLMLLVVLTIW
jgi:hypothetical protein